MDVSKKCWRWKELFLKLNYSWAWRSEITAWACWVMTFLIEREIIFSNRAEISHWTAQWFLRCCLLIVTFGALCMYLTDFDTVFLFRVIFIDIIAVILKHFIVCFAELHVLLGICSLDGLLHQPPALHAPQWVHTHSYTFSFASQE